MDLRCCRATSSANRSRAVSRSPEDMRPLTSAAIADSADSSVLRGGGADAGVPPAALSDVRDVLAIGYVGKGWVFTRASTISGKAADTTASVDFIPTRPVPL